MSGGTSKVITTGSPSFNGCRKLWFCCRRAEKLHRFGSPTDPTTISSASAKNNNKALLGTNEWVEVLGHPTDKAFVIGVVKKLVFPFSQGSEGVNYYSCHERYDNYHDPEIE